MTNFYPYITAFLAVAFCFCAVLFYVVDKFTVTAKQLPRLAGWSIMALGLLVGIGIIAPHNLPVLLYKLSLVVIGAIVGYWLDRALFPYARPHMQYNCANAPAQSYACLRRALIVIACVLGLTMGL